MSWTKEMTHLFHLSLFLEKKKKMLTEEISMAMLLSCLKKKHKRSISMNTS